MSDDLKEILEEKEKLLEMYEVDKYGLIKDPGKFGGLPIYAPYFYDKILDSAVDYSIYDELGYTYDIFIITKEEKKAFPDLKGVYAVMCWETSEGFFEMEYFRNKSELKSAIKSIEGT